MNLIQINQFALFLIINTINIFLQPGKKKKILIFFKNLKIRKWNALNLSGLKTN